MDKKFISELKRLGEEMNDLIEEIDNDTKEKNIQLNKVISAEYNIMKADLEEMQELTREAKLKNIKVTIPCDFTDERIKEFKFWFPGINFSNHKEVGLEYYYGKDTSSNNKREFAGWLYSWDYSKGIIAQDKGFWKHKYLEQIFIHIVDDWNSLKPVIETEFIRQYKLQLTDRVQEAIRKNEKFS